MNLRAIEPPALYKLIGYLEAVSDFIRTGELKWDFDIKLFEYDEVVSDVRLLVKSAYPGSFPDKAQIIEGSLSDLVDIFKHEFGRGSQQSELLTNLTPVTEMRGELWNYLNGCLSLPGARLYVYTASDMLDDFGSGGIIGNFAAVILNESQRRCLFLSGGDCD